MRTILFLVGFSIVAALWIAVVCCAFYLWRFVALVLRRRRVFAELARYEALRSERARVDRETFERAVRSESLRQLRPSDVRVGDRLSGTTATPLPLRTRLDRQALKYAQTRGVTPAPFGIDGGAA
jgi:hypothetical protein